MYLSAGQIPNTSLALAVRTDGSPEALEQPIRAIVHDLDPCWRCSTCRRSTRSCAGR